MQQLKLLDIITLDDLQQLQDAFVDVAKVASVISGIDGIPITTPSNFTRFCEIMRQNHLTGRNCQISDKHLGERSYLTQAPAQGQCRNLGLMDASAPIIIADKHVANWMVGQATREHLPDETVRRFAKEHGLSEDEVLDAYKQVPFVTEKGFQDALKLQSLFAGYLSSICYKNYLLKEASGEKGRAIATLQTVMAHVESGIYVSDPQTYRIVYMNDVLCQQLGTQDVVGRLCHELLQGRDEPCPFCPYKHLFDAQGNPLWAPYRWEFRNEKMGRDYLITDRLITWHDGRVLHLEVATDLSDRKALAVAEAANVAQRDFLARMSHELRTPMNGVLGMTHLALQADPPPIQRDYLKKIQSSAALLLGIINDILDFSRIEAGKLEVEHIVFNVREMLGNTKELLLPRAREKGLELAINVAPDVPEFALGDGLRLSQVLLNLLGNAVKFTAAGSITADISVLPPDQADLAEQKKIRLECRITDTGIGMSPEQQEVLFKPFSQADASISRQFGGTGLGLSISKALAELMGGSITVTSELGKGSTFLFRAVLLPLAQGQGAPVNARPKGTNCRVCVGKSILLVEDNEINQEIAVALLEDLGASVDVASNGVEGVQAFLKKDYALIFMDIRMPEMDGLEATRRIRGSSKYDATAVPIIAMTANAMEEDRTLSREAGMNGHIAKPIVVEELKKALDHWLTV